MTPESPSSRSLFADALELAVVDRDAFLDAECGGDAALRAEVAELLSAHDSAGVFLAGRESTPGAADTFSVAPATRAWPDTSAGAGAVHADRTGTVIAERYKLVEPIGEGGMGTVWMAQQTEPVRRLVALKLVKDGMDTRQVLARFEAERQALAIMDHPNIARVLDAGATATGRPFFVMEMVKGVPITQFCDDRKLTARERLALFVPVCQAIQHAHQKGVIHRDVKPSNVLVALYDDRPVPKVIDFGVAKAVGQPLTDLTLHTGYGSIVGTPQYMAPEQATFNNLDVDTRADVYALGALLYELLAGSPPFGAGELRKAGLVEMLRIVREDAPPRPSSRLSSSITLASVAACRGAEPRTLVGQLRGELDWIVMRALEKDRNRRYETANGLAKDVERYLAGERVHAVPASAGYRARTFVRRNRGPVAAAAVLVVSLVVGAIGTTVGLIRADVALGEAEISRIAAEAAGQRAEEQRVSALAERDAKEVARRKAEDESKRADERAAVARAVSDFLQQDLLLQVDSNQQAARGQVVNPNLTVREALDRAAARVGERFRDQPRAEAEVQLAIGQAYSGLQQPALAAAHLARALALLSERLGPDDPETVAAATQLGMTLLYLPERRAEGTALVIGAEKATRARKGDDDLETVRAGHSVGIAHLWVGRADLALPLLERSVERTRALAGRNDPLTADAVGGLAQVYERLGRRADALDLLKDALRIKILRLTSDNPDILTAKGHLGLLYHAEKRYAEAEPLLTEVFEGRLRLLGVGHRWTWHSARELAAVLFDLGRFDEAFSYAGRAVDGSRITEGVGSGAELAALAVLDRSYNAARAVRPEPALPQHLAERKANYLRLKKERGDSDRATLDAMRGLAQAYRVAGRSTEALPILESLLRESLSHDPAAKDVQTQADMDILAMGYQEAGQMRSAVPLFEETLARRKATLPPLNANIVSSFYNLAQAYLIVGREAQALPLFKAALEAQRMWWGPEDPRFCDLLVRTSVDLLAARRYAAAEPYLRESLAALGKGEAHWLMDYTRSLLGAALLGQKKYDAAEPLLAAGYRGLAPHAETVEAMKPKLAGAAERLEILYLARGKPTEAAKWHSERAKYPAEEAPTPRPGAKK